MKSEPGAKRRGGRKSELADAPEKWSALRWVSGTVLLRDYDAAGKIGSTGDARSILAGNAEVVN